MSKPLRLPTLLVVAENPSVRFWVKKHLDEQFFILTAQTRQEAIQALNARLDFIIVDASLEQGDALDLCNDLSKMTQRGMVPILLITGRLKKSFRDKAIALGVTDFLSDQLDAEELMMRIDAGQKAACMRQKTEDLSAKIKPPSLSGASSLKKRFVLTDQALRQFAAAKEQEKPVALLLIRIDQTEEVPFSPFVSRYLREKDVLIPSTEGNWVILLFDMTVEKARSFAERLREGVQEHRFETAEGAKQITISIALSSLEASEKGFHQMIDAAAKSLKTHSETNLILSLDQEMG